ncbi:cation:proton antiporter [Legionella sp. CNM-4043-24]|uniref:cation:proton antiporter n=1 Tax=Legionella sp. CNM-4043-24 TaxID=3421646 RepID=UPI00403B3897
MHHSLPLISTIATALGLALLMGFIAVKIRLPTLVGYLVAGVIIGPFTPGFVANAGIAAELAEIGIMLLMFGVGLHFSLEHLLETRKIALPGALLQIVAATLMGAALAICWGWGWASALVFGLALSVASTVVLIRALESQGILGSFNGQIAVGWLIVEDLVMILVLVFLPLLAGWAGSHPVDGESKNLWWVLGLTLFKMTSFVIVMLLAGRWVVPRLLWHITRTGSRELFTLSVIAAALGIAFGASRLFGMSFALGAFFAGMIMRESKFSRRAAEESLPFRDAFAVLFFVSIGMLFNPGIFISQPLEILAVVAVIVVGKSLAAALLVIALRYPLNTALTVSASLAQIGEFSFILAGLGVHLKLLPTDGLELIIGGALLSIAINPFVFKIIEPLQTWLRSKASWTDPYTQSIDPLSSLPMSTDAKFLSGQVVLVGYGRVGRRIERILAQQELPYVVVDQDRCLVEQLGKRKIVAVYGDASDPNVLIQAHIARAGMLVIATSDTFNVRQMIHIAHQLNPKIEIAVRVQSEEDALLLKQDHDFEGKFFFSERELAHGMSRYILNRFGMSWPG